MREPFNTSNLHSYDERTLAGIPAIGQKSGIIGGDCPAKRQDRQQVKRQDLIEDPIAAFCDVPPWRLGFSGGDPHQFNSLERKRGLDDDSDHGEEASRASFFQIGIDSPRVMPEAEPAH